MYAILFFILLLCLIPLTISLSYFLLGISNIVIGIKEKNNLKARSGAKTILYSLIAFMATLLIGMWLAELSIKELFNLFLIFNYPLNPTFRCPPSQYGLLPEAPHLHKATVPVFVSSRPSLCTIKHSVLIK